MSRRVVFLTGTRADFGKLKSLMRALQNDMGFDVHVFITGMHMLSKYGYTCEEVEKAGFKNLFRFINQNQSDSMDHILAKTITGLSDYVKEISPELIVIHGDRVEALAGAAVGALNNIRVAHIEGGEVSGTVDELIRHAVTKLSHGHFVSNEQAKNRLIQLGESEESIFVIGSPDIDVMNSTSLPSIDDVRERYGFSFEHYGILMYHPVTSELDDLPRQAKAIVDYISESSLPFIVVYPNNDHGSDIILNEYLRLKNLSHVRVYPSIRFEYFLTLLKNAAFIMGNSSAGVREAPHFGVPAINVGSRQHNRATAESILNTTAHVDSLRHAVQQVADIPRVAVSDFGNGNSAGEFHQILLNNAFWDKGIQKHFIDRSAV